VSAEPTPLGPADLEACLALDKRSLGRLWSRRQWGTELADPQRPVLGLWGDGRLLAMACGWLILDELHITLVAVDPAERRRGHGRRVLRGLLEAAGERGAERATLEVASGNAAALALYRSLGFREAGRRPGYYRDGDDALIHWLRLEDG
jgi:ribosomal-protein-alanine N-acetyltransferase